MSNHPFFLPLILACATVLVSVHCPARVEWVELGSARATLSGKKVIIYPASSTTYEKVRFHITDGNINIRNARIYFDKGRVVNFSIQKMIRGDRNGTGGGNSRSLHLTGRQQRSINKVEIFYSLEHLFNPARDARIYLMGVPGQTGN